MASQKIIAHIESNKNGFFTVYYNEDLPFGCFGEGRSAEEAVKDFQKVFEALRQDHLKRTGEKLMRHRRTQTPPQHFLPFV